MQRKHRLMFKNKKVMLVQSGDNTMVVVMVMVMVDDSSEVPGYVLAVFIQSSDGNLLVSKHG